MGGGAVVLGLCAGVLLGRGVTEGMEQSFAVGARFSPEAQARRAEQERARRAARGDAVFLPIPAIREVRAPARAEGAGGANGNVQAPVGYGVRDRSDTGDTSDTSDTSDTGDTGDVAAAGGAVE